MFRLALSLLLVLACAGPLLAQGAPKRVVVTYFSRSIASIDLFIVQNRGFLKEEGLDAQLVQVRATAAHRGARVRRGPFGIAGARREGFRFFFAA
jgi:hypothetical protein